ncbi:MAG: hypothetical protein VXX85_06770 [Candidatus Margulisiibacteriota bacterium]|nr:hypothetical protein [Candidatus Margulisiibacteriota bacterium]
MNFDSISIILSSFFPDRRVKNGPFKGMKYLGFEHYRSNIFPHLLGSYEMELRPIINKIMKKKFRTVINIGAGHGHYLVGLARHFKESFCYAFESDPACQTICKKTALINNVNDRVTIFGKCDSDLLLSLPLEEALIICDCEGYERVIFNQKNISQFKSSELLIETHDCFFENCSATLKYNFQPTHSIESVRSIDDHEKATTYHFSELAGLNDSTKKIFLAEKRTEIMEWLHVVPRQ